MIFHPPITVRKIFEKAREYEQSAIHLNSQQRSTLRIKWNLDAEEEQTLLGIAADYPRLLLIEADLPADPRLIFLISQSHSNPMLWRAKDGGAITPQMYREQLYDFVAMYEKIENGGQEFRIRLPHRMSPVRVAELMIDIPNLVSNHLGLDPAVWLTVGSYEYDPLVEEAGEHVVKSGTEEE